MGGVAPCRPGGVCHVQALTDAPAAGGRRLRARMGTVTVHTQHPLELTDLLNGFDITTDGGYEVAMRARLTYVASTE